MNTITRRSTTFNRVLVVDNQGIMGAGLERLLSEEPSLEVMGITIKSETTLVQEIWRLQPDIIILTAESQGTSPTWLLNLLSDYGCVRIILVSMDNNIFEVYDKKRMTAIDQATLIEQIKKRDEIEEAYSLLRTRL